MNITTFFGEGLQAWISPLSDASVTGKKVPQSASILLRDIVTLCRAHCVLWTGVLIVPNIDAVLSC